MLSLNFSIFVYFSVVFLSLVLQKCFKSLNVIILKMFQTFYPTFETFFCFVSIWKVQFCNSVFFVWLLLEIKCIVPSKVLQSLFCNSVLKVWKGFFLSIVLQKSFESDFLKIFQFFYPIFAPFLCFVSVWKVEFCNSVFWVWKLFIFNFLLDFFRFFSRA